MKYFLCGHCWIENILCFLSLQTSQLSIKISKLDICDIISIFWSVGTLDLYIGFLSKNQLGFRQINLYKLKLHKRKIRAIKIFQLKIFQNKKNISESLNHKANRKMYCFAYWKLFLWPQVGATVGKIVTRHIFPTIHISQIVLRLAILRYLAIFV